MIEELVDDAPPGRTAPVGLTGGAPDPDDLYRSKTEAHIAKEWEDQLERARASNGDVDQDDVDVHDLYGGGGRAWTQPRHGEPTDQRETPRRRLPGLCARRPRGPAKPIADACRSPPAHPHTPFWRSSNKTNDDTQNGSVFLSARVVPCCSPLLSPTAVLVLVLSMY